MEIIISAILLTTFVWLCCYNISQGINKSLQSELEKQKELTKEFLNLFHNEQRKTDTLYSIIKHIKSQLSLLGLTECPEEELKRIPFEIVGWIEQLEIVSKGEDSELHK